MEKFKSFISEEIVDTYRVAILTVEFGDKSITAKKLEKFCLWDVSCAFFHSH